MYDGSVGFISDLAFVIAANLAACACALALVVGVGRRNVPSGGTYRWRRVLPWVATVAMLLGSITGYFLRLGIVPQRFFEIASLLVALLCGIGLALLYVVWINVFLLSRDASTVFAQIVCGYGLYTLLGSFFHLVAGPVSLALVMGALVLSTTMAERTLRCASDEPEGNGRFFVFFRRDLAPVLICFYVLVGVVGIIHTSVLGSSVEGVLGFVPMWVTRVASFIVFALVALAMGQSPNPSTVFRWAFPALIVTLTLMPFLSGTMGSLSGFLVIVCYTVCSMVFYLFLIREGRRLRLSGDLLAGIYMLGSSGALLVGLLIGFALRAVSANFGLSLLTMLAFAAIYPLALVLIPLIRRERQEGQSGTLFDEPDAGEELEKRLLGHTPPSYEDFSRAVTDIAGHYGLTRREREVLAYLVTGRSVRYIAETLVMSENTAWTHAKRIYAKTGTHGKQDLMDLIDRTLRDEH